jgi:hypothetical protein
MASPDTDGSQTSVTVLMTGLSLVCQGGALPLSFVEGASASDPVVRMAGFRAVHRCRLCSATEREGELMREIPGRPASALMSTPVRMAIVEKSDREKAA